MVSPAGGELPGDRPDALPFVDLSVPDLTGQPPTGAAPAASLASA